MRRSYIVRLVGLLLLVAPASHAQAQKTVEDSNANVRPLHILIMVDMEGVHGIADTRLLNPRLEWEVYGRMLLTEEINSAAEGVQLAAAEENREGRAYVSSAHNFGRNIDLLRLTPFVHLLEPHSATSPVMAGKDQFRQFYEEYRFDAAIFLGYYAKAGSPGYLAHTIDGRLIERIALDGRPVGEIDLLANLCGSFGIPVVMVSGDRTATEEAAAVIENVQTVVTKEKLQNSWVALRPVDEVLNAIKGAVLDGVKKRTSIKILRPGQPTKIELDLKMSESLQKLVVPAYVSRDGSRLSWQQPSFLQAYTTLWKIYVRLFLD